MFYFYCCFHGEITIFKCVFCFSLCLIYHHLVRGVVEYYYHQQLDNRHLHVMLKYVSVNRSADRSIDESAKINAVYDISYTYVVKNFLIYSRGLNP